MKKMGKIEMIKIIKQKNDLFLFFKSLWSKRVPTPT
jgi:hypothetical protein